MADELNHVSVPCLGLSLSSAGQEALLCMSLTDMFRNQSDDEDDNDDDDDDAYLEDVVIFETDDDTVEFLRDAVVYDNDDDDAPKMIKPASKSAIEGLDKVKIDERTTSSVSCSVCLEDFSMGSEARRLPCSHVYHAACIIEWLQEHNTCPLCRYQMPVVDFDLNFPLTAIDS